MAPAHLHPDQLRWNQKYAAAGLEVFGREPSNWLVEHKPLLTRQPRGPALDVAAGNGRHAFYLARLGFTVDALDISDVAIAWIGDQARRRQLDVRPHQVNLETEPLPKEKYQIVVNINYLERRIFAELATSLVPGGLLLFETMTTDQSDVLGKKIDHHFLLEHNELVRSFGHLQILEHHEGTVQNSLGTEKAVARLVARKGDLP